MVLTVGISIAHVAGLDALPASASKLIAAALTRFDYRTNSTLTEGLTRQAMLCGNNQALETRKKKQRPNQQNITAVSWMMMMMNDDD